MTSKAKAIEAFGRIKDVYRTHTINLQDVVDVQNQLNNPTLDDAIKVVEGMFAKENERLRKITQAYYSKSWLVTLSKNILAYNINFQMEVLNALKGLKEGKGK